MAARTAISMASRSSRPVLRRSAKMTFSSRSTFVRDFLLNDLERFFPAR